MNITSAELAMTTSAPLPMVWEDPKVEENDKKTKCSSDSAIGGLVLTPGDTSMSTVDYFECRKLSKPEKTSIKDNNEERIQTISHQVCTNNRVLVSFEAFDSENSTLKRWQNLPVMWGVCHTIENYIVNDKACENITVSNKPWEGEDHKESSNWDTIFYCPQNTLAIGMTWEKDNNNTYKITNLICCPIIFIQ